MKELVLGVGYSVAGAAAAEDLELEKLSVLERVTRETVPIFHVKIKTVADFQVNYQAYEFKSWQ